MATAERSAKLIWEGDLPSGSGTFTTGSGAMGEMPVTWASRTQSPEGKTSPEELIAAAHASCYAMALSHTLGQDGHTPERLEVDAVCTLDEAGGGFKITSMTLNVTADVPGADEDGFRKAIEATNQGCPVSNALRGNVDIDVNATLNQ
ncbi:peroxiredoxin, OsmC subfamily [Rubrobacter radiotolerans]|uniref:OsmC family protein n=1 Tax=Rubrobacter radiotolerans TaxID=42256 RepID=A0A023X758_RUBRA|nr:OsmC family protein [Rubrobacter radiotolerans]AHY47870.1 peroxiredoxin, OsmC subfamily [Rubrobacter radiotolerans]MDX5892508.1 OsmC family protein [Rubrobacter radiotolerans]SMC07799.1 osmotically inducible protein OsmC [Rubrobacter radiotolerans DSM 5868]